MQGYRIVRVNIQSHRLILLSMSSNEENILIFMNRFLNAKNTIIHFMQSKHKYNSIVIHI